MKQLTQVQFYSYRLQLRNDEIPSIHMAGRLFQQYICDIWVSSD